MRVSLGGSEGFLEYVSASIFVVDHLYSHITIPLIEYPGSSSKGLPLFIGPPAEVVW